MKEGAERWKGTVRKKLKRKKVEGGHAGIFI
jgi:hypothetical protein